MKNLIAYQASWHYIMKGAAVKNTNIWRIPLASLGICVYQYVAVMFIFGNWVHGIDYKYRILLRVGAMALIWSLWLCRNDKVFYNKNSSLLQVIYRCTGTPRLWSQLHHTEDHDLFWRCVRVWRIWRDTYFRGMDDSIIYGLAHRQLRRLTIYVIRLVFLLLYIKPCVW
jgi:hypothetical protein